MNAPMSSVNATLPANGVEAVLRRLLSETARRVGRPPRALEVGSAQSQSRLDAVAAQLPLEMLNGAGDVQPDLILLHPEMEFEPLVRTLYALRSRLGDDTLVCALGADAPDRWPALAVALRQFFRVGRMEEGLWIADREGIALFRQWPDYASIAHIVHEVHAEQARTARGAATESAGGLSPEAVTWAYRLFLDREPQTTAERDEKCRLPDAAALRRALAESPEFKQKNPNLFWLSCSSDEPPMVLRLDTTVAEKQALLAHVQATWEHLGATEPHWSVLTADKFRRTHIAQHSDDFYRTGETNVQTLWRTLARNGVDASNYQVCLEYGCGLGRVTRWLAPRFSRVHGYDISRAHLQGAARYFEEQGVGNVDLHHISAPADLGRLERADLVYSVIVLQHNPPPIIEMIIAALLDSLNPGGAAFFQVPTYQRGYRFVCAEYLAQREGQREMEMHVLPQARIFALAAAAGVSVLEVLEDKWTNIVDGGRSNTFVLRRD